MDLRALRESTSAVITVTDAAELLGINRRTVIRAMEDGEVPVLRLGRRRLIPREPLLALLTTGSVSTSPVGDVA